MQRELSYPGVARHAAAFAGLLMVTGVSTPAHGQWTARNLNPPYEFVQSDAFSGAGTQVVVQQLYTGGDSHERSAELWDGTPSSGYIVSLTPAGATESVGIGTNGTRQWGWAAFGNVIHAGLWSGTAASWVDLHPAGATSSDVTGIAGTQQVGNAWFGGDPWSHHAGLWHGTAASWIDLNPTGASGSDASGTTGTQQVGFAIFGGARHAGVWNGTAASWIDLNPAGSTESAAWSFAGTQQSGYAKLGGNEHASLWHGTAASWVDLNPAGATSSRVSGTTGTQQVGWATFGSATHAGLWSGTAGTWVDLNPAGATNSGAFATFGTTQAGYALLGNGYYQPGVWHGTAASWEALPYPPPEDFNDGGGWAYGAESVCWSVWTDGSYLYAAGYVARGHEAGTTHCAVLWSRPILPCPADLNNDGVIDLPDLTILLAHFGQSGVPASAGDLNGDGAVSLTDLALLLSEFGQACP